MVPELLDLYARRIHGLVLVLGPRSLDRIILVLRALGLAEEEAKAVVTHAITRGLLEVDPSDAALVRTTRPVGIAC